MTPLGMISEDEATVFLSRHPQAVLGSMSASGRRRIMTEATGADLLLLKRAFAEMSTAIAVEQAYMELERCSPCQERAIGDRLADIIKGHRPNETPCAECLQEIERLNNMTPEQVAAEAKEIAMRIVQRASRNASSPIDRLLTQVLPSISTAVVSRWINEALSTTRASDV